MEKNYKSLVVLKLYNCMINGKKREFYGSISSNDFIGYVDHKCRAGATDKGIYDEKGEVSSSKKKKIRKELRSTLSPIRVILLSLDDSVLISEDKKKLIGLAEGIVEDWARTTDQKVSNLRWIAAFHMHTKHRHIHILLWEKEKSKRLVPILKDGELVKKDNDLVFEEKDIEHRLWGKQKLSKEQLAYLHELVLSRVICEKAFNTRRLEF